MEETLSYKVGEMKGGWEPKKFEIQIKKRKEVGELLLGHKTYHSYSSSGLAQTNRT